MSTNRTRATAIIRKTAHNVAAVAALLAVGLSAMTEAPYEPAERPAAAQSPAQVVSANDCWTGAAPEGVEPTRVVYSKGNSGALVGGPAKTARALEQVLGGEDAGWTIHGFCR